MKALFYQWRLFACAAVLLPFAKTFGDPSPPEISRITVSNAQQHVSWTPYPGVESYRLLSTDSLLGLFQPNTNGTNRGFTWSGPMNGPQQFHRIHAQPVDSNVIFGATLLNRIAYGPTPDELERILTGPNAIGPNAFLEEQLAPENIIDNVDTSAPDTNLVWTYVAFTDYSNGTNFFLHLNAAGVTYVDDIVLVQGATPEGGPNLIQNGDFEAPLAAPWALPTNMLASEVSADFSHSGASCLKVVATAPGTGNGSAIRYPFALRANTNSPYTLSYWYLADPEANSSFTMTLRLTSQIGVAANIRPPIPVYISSILGRLTNGVATIYDLRAYHALHALRSKHQLLEVLLQFFDNHFNTQYSKTRDWFGNNFTFGTTTNGYLAVDLEFRELSQWRNVLLDPNGTFYDLLKISAFSPAMNIYLDSVLSTRTAPNENYPRELLELFTMGSDNGYTQNDINELSKAWTGYRVRKKAPELANDPFAPPVASYTNDAGIWVMHFLTNSHHTGTKYLFTNTVIHPRFGSLGGGAPYALVLANGAGTNGYKDAEQVIAHLVDLPYTQEFMSVKLCQFFVHENFEFGVYDYRQSNLSPEAALIKACIETWRRPGPDGRRGNLRNILRTIFASELFRGQGASHQKIKSPFEFTISSLRAIRALKSGDFYTAETDGFGVTGVANVTSPLARIGNMGLFDRSEPDGWPEMGRLWLNTANLCERFRWCDHLLMASTNGSKTTDYNTAGRANISDPVALLKMRLPPAAWQQAEAVVDLFLRLLYPAEGMGNLMEDRGLALNFLNTNQSNPPTASPFAALSPTGADYDGRVRGMVALLMSLPRFQEQ